MAGNDRVIAGPMFELLEQRLFLSADVAGVSGNGTFCTQVPKGSADNSIQLPISPTSGETPYGPYSRNVDIHSETLNGKLTAGSSTSLYVGLGENYKGFAEWETEIYLDVGVYASVSGKLDGSEVFLGHVSGWFTLAASGTGAEVPLYIPNDIASGDYHLIAMVMSAFPTSSEPDGGIIDWNIMHEGAVTGDTIQITGGTGPIIPPPQNPVVTAGASSFAANIAAIPATTADFVTGLAGAMLAYESSIASVAGSLIGSSDKASVAMDDGGGQDSQSAMTPAIEAGGDYLTSQSNDPSLLAGTADDLASTLP